MGYILKLRISPVAKREREPFPLLSLLEHFLEKLCVCLSCLLHMYVNLFCVYYFLLIMVKYDRKFTT